jgi:plastocyanin
MKKLLLITLLLTVGVLLLPLTKAPQSCCAEPELSTPFMLYASEIKVSDTDLKALTFEQGGVKGLLSFSRRRPTQPLVIYLQRVDGELKYKTPKEQIMKQKNARFDPAFITVLRGQKVVFDNNEKEKINHNVYFLGGEEEDLGVFAKNSKVTYQFDKVGEVEVYCSIHSLMDAKIFVAPNPHYLILSKDQQSFEIKNVPEGKYLLKTYQKARRFKNVSLKIEVKAGRLTEKNIEMKR